MTLNQLIRKLEEIRSLHRQLNSFHWGNPASASDGEAPRYPLMGAFLNPGNLGQRTDLWRLVVYFASRIEDQDERLQQEVSSNMRTIALGVYAQLKNYLHSNGIKLSPDATLDWFDDAEWDDKCYGWKIELVITQFFPANACQEPSSFDPSAEDNGVVRIINIETGALVDTANPGEDYGVLVFSGIHGGSASTVFTNQIVGNP